MKVFVYYNLHRKLWSVKALEGPRKGRVIAHSHYVVLRDAVGKVSQAGRERVLRERRKNVHAGIVGTLVEAEAHQIPARKVTYNPYKYETFVYADDQSPFEGTSFAVLAHKSVFVA